MRILSSVVTMLFVFTLSGFAGPVEVKLKKGDRIVFFGDSITAGGSSATGYISLIKDSVNKTQPVLGVEFINAGVSGNKVMDLQARVQKAVLDKKPSIVFIFIGANDVGHWGVPRRTGTTKEQFESGLKEIIGKIRAVNAQVVLCTPAVLGEKTDGTNSRGKDKMLDEYSDIDRRLATDLELPLVDLHNAFTDYLKANNPENQEKGILTTDGVHLSPAGNKLVAEQMLKVLGVKMQDKL